MSFPTLRQLGVERLLEDPALAMSALEVLPCNLFVPFLEEVVVKSRVKVQKGTDGWKGMKEVLRATVQAWPFPCLPLGDLLCRTDRDIMAVILETLDMLLEQEVWPRCKLRVIDLQNTFLNIWTVDYLFLMGSEAPLTDRPATNHHPERTEEPPLRIFTNIVLSDSPLEWVLPHVLPWAEMRKGRVQLYCKRLQIFSPCTSISIFNIQSFLRMLHLDAIQELVVDVLWNQENMENMVPYLVQMKNLRILSLTRINIGTRSYQFKKFYKYIVQVLKEKNLQELHICQVLFLYGKLHKVLRILKPLTTLSLNGCSLMQEDLRLLSQCPCTSQLKHLYLSNVHMGHFSAEPLRALLERVAGTVETLAIEHCEITDAQLSAILPTLSQCSKLSLFSFFGNPISTAALQNLLRHTARLSQLSEGLYPAPLDIYGGSRLYPGECCLERFSLVCARLVQFLRHIQPAHEVRICAPSCVCERCQLYRLASRDFWVLTEDCPFSSYF